jgi:O-antigen/teichoic acid export membrane protein
MTWAEVVLLRRRSRLIRVLGLASALCGFLAAALVVAADGDWAWGLIIAAVAFLMYLNFWFYWPWIVERAIRKGEALSE